MVNRLSNYLSSAKLAKLHLVSAREQLSKNDVKKAAAHLTEALEYAITAMNNVASIGFNHRPRR